MIARRRVRDLPAPAVCVAVLIAVLALVLAASGILARGLFVWPAVMLFLGLLCVVLAAWLYLSSARPLPTPLEPISGTRAITLNWLAPWYDLTCSKVGLGGGFRRFLLERAAIRPGDRVLDLSCGTGAVAQLAAQAAGPGGEVWGVDAAPDMVRLAFQSGARLRRRAHFRPAAPEQLPFPDSSFDVVLASLLLCRLPPQAKELALLEAKRVLKPGGRLVVADLDTLSGGAWPLLALPLRVHGCTAAHVRGRTGEILQQAGFAAPVRTGRWGPLSTWEVAIPAEGRRSWDA